MTGDNGDGPWGKSSEKNKEQKTNGQRSPSGGGPVSYTHLTLPTKA